MFHAQTGVRKKNKNKKNHIKTRRTCKCGKGRRKAKLEDEKVEG